MSDDELLRRLSDLVSRSRRLDAEVVAHIAEVDARRLYAREATPSMFAYCVQVLGLGESEAYLRIAAARASRESPLVLEMLRDGSLLLSAAARLASHLTPENCESVLRRAAHRNKRGIEELIAELAPQPDARSVIRKLPAPRDVIAPVVLASSGAMPGPTCLAPAAVPPRAGSTAPNGATQLVPERVEWIAVNTGAGGGGLVRSHEMPTPARRTCVQPIAPSRHKVQFTASDELRGKLERLQALMRTTVPDGDLATIIDQAVTEKLERLEAKRLGKARQPRKRVEETDTAPSSRHIPAPVRRAVHEGPLARAHRSSAFDDRSLAENDRSSAFDDSLWRVRSRAGSWCPSASRRRRGAGRGED